MMSSMLICVSVLSHTGHPAKPMFRHVKCNGSPVSLTEKGTVFHKTDI